MTDLPPPTERTCRECPWRRASAAGWLGPYTAEEWAALVVSDEAIACHFTITKDGEWAGARQCAGAAQMRRNIAKMPRDRTVAVAAEVDTQTVFATPREFVTYHRRENA